MGIYYNIIHNAHQIHRGKKVNGIRFKMQIMWLRWWSYPEV